MRFALQVELRAVDFVVLPVQRPTTAFAAGASTGLLPSVDSESQVIGEVVAFSTCASSLRSG